MKKMGYIGKSFALGSLGILGSIIAACGGGGVTDVVAQASTPPSPYVLFASGFKMKAAGANDTWAETLQGGDATTFSGNDLAWRWDLGRSDSQIGGNPDWLKQQQAYGVLFGKNANVDASSGGYAGLSIKAPENASINISSSGTMVLQTGNGNPVGSDANAFMTYVVELAAGEQGGAPEYAWPIKCSYDLDLTPGSRPSGPDGTQAVNLTNPFGLQTYEIALTDFTCEGGTLAELKADLRNVSIVVLGAKNVNAASDTADREVFLKVGQISFAK